MLKHTAQIFYLKLILLQLAVLQDSCPATAEEHLERDLQRGEPVSEGKVAVRPH